MPFLSILLLHIRLNEPIVDFWGNFVLDFSEWVGFGTIFGWVLKAGEVVMNESSKNFAQHAVRGQS